MPGDNWRQKNVFRRDVRALHMSFKSKRKDSVSNYFVSRLGVCSGCNSVADSRVLLFYDRRCSFFQEIFCFSMHPGDPISLTGNRHDGVCVFSE